MIRAVLVGSDLSRASDTIVRQASEIARHGGAQLHVVSAYPPPTSTLPDSRGDVPEAVMAEVREALPAQLRRILPESERPASMEVRFGSAAEAILDRARETSADLIVLGAHRGRDVHAQFLGTTADEVLRHASVPCLVIRGTVALPLRRIGAASDFSKIGHRALEVAAEYARFLGVREGEPTRIIAGHVLRPREGTSSAECEARLLEDLRAAIQEAASEAGVAPEAKALLDADVPGALVAWADRARLDLLVTGTHGKTGWQRDLLGSVSSALARRAPCPVLLVPGGGVEG